MTPSEIITEALYNIYGSSTPDASVKEKAAVLLERIHHNVQRKVPWWFLERVFTSPAVNMDFMTFKPDGVVDFPGEIQSIAYCNGKFVILVNEGQITDQQTYYQDYIYTVDPKTLQTQKCGYFLRRLTQACGELRTDTTYGKLYIRLSNAIYQITEEGDTLKQFVLTAENDDHLIKDTGIQKWKAGNGGIYVAWDHTSGGVQSTYPIYGIYKYTESSAKKMGVWATLQDFTPTDGGILVLIQVDSRLSWIGDDGDGESATLLADGYARNGVNNSCITITSYDEFAFFNTPMVGGNTMRIRWMDTTYCRYGDYAHKGSITVRPWGGDFASFLNSVTSMPVSFCYGRTMFASKRNTNGLSSILRMTREKIGNISETLNSQGGEIKRVPAGAYRAKDAAGSVPIYYTDEEASMGKRDINFYPEAERDFVQMRAIVYVEYDPEETDIVIQNLSEYMVKKLTAEISLVTEYADRYAAYAAAAEDALTAVRSRGCDFDAQELTPGYCGC